jgi:hypothetical protein
MGAQPGRFVRYRELCAGLLMGSARGESTYTIWQILKEAGFDWQRTRSWCETGTVKRKRKSGEVVEVTDPDTEAKKFDRTRLPRG